MILLNLFSLIFLDLTCLSSFIVHNYFFFFSFKKKKKERNLTGELVQWLRAFIAVPEDLGFVPSTPMTLTTVCNSSFRANNAM